MTENPYEPPKLETKEIFWKFSYGSFLGAVVGTTIGTSIGLLLAHLVLGPILLAIADILGYG